MPWQEVCIVDLRMEFVHLAEHGGLSFSALCRRFKISRKTGYKWLKRHAAEGAAGLADRSRRPHRQPGRTPPEVEERVLAYHRRFEVWGGRKLARVMRDLGEPVVPSPNTISAILDRHGEPRPGIGSAQPKFIRFEHPQPNDLWQMDFKGEFQLGRGSCHPLTILDDHSRFAVCLAACANERQATVQQCLIVTFEQYGLPLRMTMDNGSPWGCGGQGRLTQLTVWLIEQGVTTSHSRPYHPQTQGKDERFHRTLDVELLGRRTFVDLPACQREFDPWRHRYNTLRPHEALQLDRPIQHYRPSPRTYRPNLPAYEYGPTDAVRKVSNNLHLSFKKRQVFISQALKGKHVALRPTIQDGVYTIHFCHQKIGEVDLRQVPKR